MKLLLDTHILLWAAGAPDRLAQPVRTLLQLEQNELWFSAISLWEIAIKSALRRSDFRADPRILYRALLDNGYRELALIGRHTLEIDLLPALHKDPFDRMLVAQATVEGLTLLTADDMVAKYPGPVLHTDNVGG